MPATYTHYAFTKDVFKVISESVRNKIREEENIFNMFGHSFDVLFFIKSKSGSYAHNNNVNLYFKNIVKYIRDNNLQDNGEVLAYLYGSICHYVLDSIVHPYVYYKTGKYNSKDKTTRKYIGKHNYFEYMIDALVYQERNAKPIYNVKLDKEIMPKILFSEELRKCLDYSYFNTFGLNSGGKLVYRGYNNYRFVLAHVMVSKFGIKKALYLVIDKLGIIRDKKLSNLCYHIKKTDNRVLNLEHKKWFYPVDKKINYHYSFYDLYDIAILRAQKYIESLDKSLNQDDKSVNKVLREIGNLSYCTGKNCNKDYPMKYFEY